MSQHRLYPPLAAGLLLAVACPLCGAGVTAVPAANVAGERDVLLTMLARRTLWRDAELAPLNLGVRVRNRVATLWGPVPTADLGFKAEQRLRGLVELLEVRSELTVAPTTAAAPVTLPARFVPPPSPALPGLPRAMPTPPPLPPPPTIGAPAPVIDETELPPRRLPAK